MDKVLSRDAKAFYEQVKNRFRPGPWPRAPVLTAACLGVEENTFRKGEVAELRGMRPSGIFPAAPFGVAPDQAGNGPIGVDDDQRRAPHEQVAPDIAGKAHEIGNIATIDEPVTR